MTKRELSAVVKRTVPLLVTYVAGVVEQRRDDCHLGTCGAEAVGELDAALTAGDKPCEGQAHVQRMLHVVIRRIATFIAGKFSSEQPLEVVECKPELIERSARERLRNEFAHSIADRGRTTDLHRISHVVIVTSILRQYFLLLLVYRWSSHRRHWDARVIHITHANPRSAALTDNRRRVALT